MSKVGTKSIFRGLFRVTEFGLKIFSQPPTFLDPENFQKPQFFKFFKTSLMRIAIAMHSKCLNDFKQIKNCISFYLLRRWF